MDVGGVWCVIIVLVLVWVVALLLVYEYRFASVW